jgi:hypothetical protein
VLAIIALFTDVRDARPQEDRSPRADRGSEATRAAATPGVRSGSPRAVGWRHRSGPGTDKRIGEPEGPAGVHRREGPGPRRPRTDPVQLERPDHEPGRTRPPGEHDRGGLVRRAWRAVARHRAGRRTGPKRSGGHLRRRAEGGAVRRNPASQLPTSVRVAPVLGRPSRDRQGDVSWRTSRVARTEVRDQHAANQGDGADRARPAHAQTRREPLLLRRPPGRRRDGDLGADEPACKERLIRCSEAREGWSAGQPARTVHGTPARLRAQGRPNSARLDAALARAPLPRVRPALGDDEQVSVRDNEDRCAAAGACRPLLLRRRGRRALLGFGRGVRLDQAVLLQAGPHAPGRSSAT